MTAWLAAVPVHLKPYFREAIGACLSRRQHILNYFDQIITIFRFTLKQMA